MVRIIAHQDKQNLQKEWLDSLAQQKREAQEKKQYEKIQEKGLSGAIPAEKQIFRTGRRTLDTIVEFERKGPQKIPDPRRAKPPHTQLTVQTDFFWDSRNTHTRIQTNNSQTSMLSTTSSKPMNAYFRTKSTLASEDPDIQQRQQATQQWKLDIEQQINEKKRREKEEKQRDELEDRMTSVKLQRQLFNQDQEIVHLKPTDTKQPQELPKYASSLLASIPIYSRIPRASKKVKEAAISDLEKKAAANLDKGTTDKLVNASKKMKRTASDRPKLPDKIEKADKLDKLPELTIKDPPAKLVEQKSSGSLTTSIKKTPVGMKRKNIDVKSKVKPIEDSKSAKESPPPKPVAPLPSKHKVLPSIHKPGMEDILESFDETPEDTRPGTPEPKPVLNPRKVPHTVKPYQRINKHAVGEMEKLKEENLEHLNNMKQLLQEKATELRELK
ncbi:hypothetical protein HDV01_005379 [Terramyces sp. JEL0728]|nr:hypothetical protein HDV01_005379 [Terramyces sp. JEL0728]